MYDSLFKQVGTEAIADLYRTGYAAYQAEDFVTSIQNLGKCYELDNTQRDALYFLARSYHKSGDTENAKIYYQKVVEESPGTRAASDAARFLAGLQ